MKRSSTLRMLTVAIISAFGLIAAACAPPAPGGGGAPAPVDWSFKGTQMHSVDSQDEVRVFGACVALPNCDDEPFLLQVAFSVTLGEPGSAQAWTVTGDESTGVSEGDTIALTGGKQAEVTFAGVQPLDVLDALNPANKMDIVGTYTWAAESDLINSLGVGANSIAGIFETALNDTIAAGVLPSDESALIQLILDLLFNNIGNAFGVIASNIPCLGLCDDVLGGRVYIGLGATGVLAGAIDAVLGGFAIPAIPMVGDNLVPPPIHGGGLYTMGGAKAFADQSFPGAGGEHEYDFLAGPG